MDGGSCSSLLEGRGGGFLFGWMQPSGSPVRFPSTDGGAWFSLSEQSTGGSETAEAAAAAALAWRRVFMAAFRLLDSNGL